MIEFAALGSGSRGNGWVVRSAETCLLIDCGFALHESVKRLARLGLAPDDLDGILVIHEHGDHIGGVARLARRYALPVWLTYGTRAAVRPIDFEKIDTRPIDSHTSFVIGNLSVTPFPVPHDAREPVQFVFSAAGRKLGIMTDVGSLTPHMIECLATCDALVVETNHDAALLQASRYPLSLKTRISGRFGHLENRVAGELLACIRDRRGGLGHLRHLVAAHLSEENNRPELAVAALAAVANGALGCIDVADQASGLGWRRLD